MGQNIGTGGRAWGKILGRCEVYTGVGGVRIKISIDIISLTSTKHKEQFVN